MKSIGLMMLIGGIVLAIAGVIFMLADRFPFLGNLPGDIHVKGRNFSFAFPIVTCLIISIVLTIVLNLIFRLMNK
jgi:hypothetical protein